MSIFYHKVVVYRIMHKPEGFDNVWDLTRSGRPKVVTEIDWDNIVLIVVENPHTANWLIAQNADLKINVIQELLPNDTNRIDQRFTSKVVKCKEQFFYEATSSKWYCY